MLVEQQEDIFLLLVEHREQIKAMGVKRIGLFGSFIHNNQHEESDVDILVEFEPDKKTFDNFMQLCFLLEDAFQRKVDVLTPDSLSPYFRESIISEAKYVTIIT